jgi:hypothetical protein
MRKESIRKDIIRTKIKEIEEKVEEGKRGSSDE